MKRRDLLKSLLAIPVLALVKCTSKAKPSPNKYVVGVDLAKGTDNSIVQLLFFPYLENGKYKAQVFHHGMMLTENEDYTIDDNGTIKVLSTAVTASCIERIK